MKRQILITGGAGFIGSHTADEFVRRGFKIRIVDNLEPPVHNKQWPDYVLGKNFELIKADVRDKKTWERSLRGVDFVFHFAAYQDQRLDFSKFFTTNTVSTALMYEVIVQKKLPIKKIVAVSTQFVYGDGRYQCLHTGKLFQPELRPLQQFQRKQWDILCPHGKPAKFIPFKEDQPVVPTNSYGLSKYALENLALRLGKTYNIPSTVVRYSIVQGPRQSPRNLYSGAIRIFVSQALAGVPITVYEDGLQIRDFVDVRDVARGNYLLMTNKKTDFGVFNIGSGKPYRVLNFAKWVKKITGSASPIILPGTFRRTDARHQICDVAKIKSLGWYPRYTPQDSIKAYLKWFKEEGFNKKINRKSLLKLRQGITK